MLITKPTRDPDLTIRDIRIDAENLTIYYKLFYSKDDTEVDWTIPFDTTFEPPEGFEDGTSWAVWTEDISKTRKKDYDWVFCEPMRNMLPAPTPLTRKLKKNNMRKELDKVQTSLDSFRALFETDV